MTHKNLAKRVAQYSRTELPDQPRNLHHQTSYLIRDLWNEVQSLKEKGTTAMTTDNLEERVLQFQTLQLPGQPQMMHMGTSNLVNDLWAEVKRLRREQNAIPHSAIRDEK